MSDFSVHIAGEILNLMTQGSVRTPPSNVFVAVIDNTGTERSTDFQNDRASTTAGSDWTITGVLVASQLPDLAITNIDVVADQTARLALNAEEGDVAIQTDISETFILSTNDPTVDSNWKKVQLDVLGAIDGQTITPAQTGTSTNPTDVEAGNIEAGTIGSSSDRPDAFLDEANVNQLTGVSTGGDRQGCRVFLSSDQSISHGTITKIQFDSEVYDSGNNFDTSSHAWTCPEDGLYLINLQLQFTGGSSGDRREIFIGSGSDPLPSRQGAANRRESSEPNLRLSVSTVNKYLSGDSIAGYAANPDGDTFGSGNQSFNTFMEVAFLGGL